MIEIDYQFINEIFQIIWDDTNLSQFIVGLKWVAVSFLIVRFITILGKDTLQQKEINIGQEKIKIPITAWNVLYYVSLVGLIASYDLLLTGLDDVLGFFVGYFDQFQASTVTVDLTAKSEKIDPEVGSWEAMKAFSLQALEFLTSPSLWLLSVIKFLVWLFDVIVYGLFISERFFILLLLKITGPFAICLSLLPGFKGVFQKWLALYARWYLLIIPYLLVNLVVNGFLLAYDILFEQFGSGGSETVNMVKNNLKVPLFLMLAILKFRLYSGGKRIYEELIDINLRDEDG